MPLRGKGEAVITEEEMWANYTYFIKAVLPVAEEAGVKMALHPDDPPVPMLGGVARLFYKPDNFKRAWEINPTSEAWGLDLCLGCCSEMPGGAANVARDDRVLRAEGAASSTSTSAMFRAPCRTSSNASSERAISIRPETMLRLKRSGFNGFLLDDHVPHMDDDTDWNHRGRAHAIGYMQGLLRMSEPRAA